MSENISVQNYLSFRVGMQRYGIRIDEVVEILHMLLLTELPSAQANILGLMTLRNTIVPVIDMRLRFGIVDPQYKLDTPIIAVRTSHGMMGLVVDEAQTVEHIWEEVISYQGIEFPGIKGVAKLPEGLLLLVDTDELVAEDSVSSLSSFSASGHQSVH